MSGSNGSTAVAESTHLKVMGLNPDIIFAFPGGASIRTERCVLIRHSEVFQRQFASSSIDNSERIFISDIQFEAFCDLIGHFYGHPVDIYEGNYLQLLYAARKYFANELTKDVVNFIFNFLNHENVVHEFEFIERYEIKMLNQQMREICQKSPLEIIKKLTTSEPHKRILKIILQTPSIPFSEFDLYTAVVEMLKRNYAGKIYTDEDFRNELGNLLYLIRFPTMTLPELVACSKKPSLLSDRQIIDLQLWVTESIFSDTLQFFSNTSRTVKPAPVEFQSLFQFAVSAVPRSDRRQTNAAIQNGPAYYSAPSFR